MDLGPSVAQRDAQGEDIPESLEAASLRAIAVIGFVAGLILHNVAPAATEAKRLFSLSVRQAA
jgi:hypothetical protein